MNILKVNVYEVNGFTVCTKSEENLHQYLEDVPLADMLAKEYKGERYIVAMGKEFEKTPCKELRHMKINQLFDSQQDATNFLQKISAVTV